MFLLNFHNLTLLILSFYHLFSYTYSRTLSDSNILNKLKNTIREKQAIDLLNKVILARHKFNSTLPLELMNTRKWIEASHLIIDFLIEPSKKDIMQSIQGTNINYLDYMKRLKDTLKSKKKPIVKISPVFEWSQDSKFVKMRVKFAKNLESPGEIDIQDFFINVTRTNFFINGYKTHEDYLIWYYRQIDLQSNIIAHETDGYKETDGTYIIRLLKETQTLYWFNLDQMHQSHHNMFTWFEVFTNYEDKAGFNDWKDKTQDNIIDSDIETYKRLKKESQIKRLKRIKNNFKFFSTIYAQNKNFCLSPLNEKYSTIPKPTDWEYWEF